MAVFRSFRVPKTIWLLLAVGLVIIIPFLCFGETVDAWFSSVMESQGTSREVGAVVLFGALALDILLPVPSSLASTWCGMLLGFWGGFWLSFSAMCVSCALGLMLGRWASPWAWRSLGEQEAATLKRFFGRYGAVVLIALRTVPVLAEASVLFAGIVRVPIRQAAPLLLIGNAAVSMAYAWVGSVGRATEAMLPAFLGAMVASGLFMLGAWIWDKRTSSLQAEPEKKE